MNAGQGLFFTESVYLTGRTASPELVLLVLVLFI